MMCIEIHANPNCPAVDMRMFHDLEPPQPVSQVRLACDADCPQWYDVTGWTTAGTPCPAMIQKVDDSGEGVVWLLYGGEAGLRLKPAGHKEPWRLEDPAQWGEPFLLVSELGDRRLTQPPESQETITRVERAGHG